VPPLKKSSLQGFIKIALSELISVIDIPRCELFIKCPNEKIKLVVIESTTL
jgi:hypothetical protein